MRFLVDTSLPPALAAWLIARGPEAQHTSEIGLASAADRAVWEQAKASGACIVTKDEDIVLMKTGNPDGPAIVWGRIGNAVRRVLLQRLAAVWPTVGDKLSQGESIVEIR